MYRIGCVPYLNAKPLIRLFARPGHGLPAEVRLDVPSQLPQWLDAGRADAVLASSFEALATPGRSAAAGLGIVSEGAVRSVRLFSRTSLDRIRTLALDASSMTSNALARIVLAERFGVRPDAQTMPPDLEAMLEACDACVLIGDAGMRAPTDGLDVFDLGEEWTGMTGLPFVWALWIGNERLSPELSGLLALARAASALGAPADPETSRRLEPWRRQAEARFGPPDAAAEIEETAEGTGWPKAEVASYLQEAIGFDLGPRHGAALTAFRELAQTHGLLAEPLLPEWVEPSLEAAEAALSVPVPK
jgi:chorismate dehydratase